MLTPAVARSETIAHKSAVSLQSQRVSSGPGSGQDVLEEDSFRCSFSNDSTLSTMLDARRGRRRMQKIPVARRPLQPVETRSSAGAAAATAFGELLGLSPTTRSLRKHT